MVSVIYVVSKVGLVSVHYFNLFLFWVILDFNLGFLGYFRLQFSTTVPVTILRF